MQKDRTQRYQTGLEMARALAAAAGAGGSDAAMQAAPAMPLSRLPDVPSMWLPQKRRHPVVEQPGDDGASGAGDDGRSRVPRTGQRRPQRNACEQGWTSGHRSPVKIAVVGASAGTLPSENLPMFSAAGEAKRGVAPALVAVFVLLALCVGFFLGWTAGRLH